MGAKLPFCHHHPKGPTVCCASQPHWCGPIARAAIRPFAGLPFAVAVAILFNSSIIWWSQFLYMRKQICYSTCNCTLIRAILKMHFWSLSYKHTSCSCRPSAVLAGGASRWGLAPALLVSVTDALSQLTQRAAEGHCCSVLVSCLLPRSPL